MWIWFHLFGQIADLYFMMSRRELQKYTHSKDFKHYPLTEGNLSRAQNRNADEICFLTSTEIKGFYYPIPIPEIFDKNRIQNNGLN